MRHWLRPCGVAATPVATVPALAAALAASALAVAATAVAVAAAALAAVAALTAVAATAGSRAAAQLCGLVLQQRGTLVRQVLVVRRRLHGLPRVLCGAAALAPGAPLATVPVVLRRAERLDCQHGRHLCRLLVAQQELQSEGRVGGGAVLRALVLLGRLRLHVRGELAVLPRVAAAAARVTGALAALCAAVRV